MKTIINLPDCIAQSDKAKQAKERCNNWAFNVVQKTKDLRKIIHPEYLKDAGFNGVVTKAQKQELSGLLYRHWEALRVRAIAEEFAPTVNIRFLAALRERNIQLDSKEALKIFHEAINSTSNRG